MKHACLYHPLHKQNIFGCVCIDMIDFSHSKFCFHKSAAKCLQILHCKEEQACDKHFRGKSRQSDQAKIMLSCLRIVYCPTLLYFVYEAGGKTVVSKQLFLLNRILINTPSVEPNFECA